MSDPAHEYARWIVAVLLALPLAACVEPLTPIDAAAATDAGPDDAGALPDGSEPVDASHWVDGGDRCRDDSDCDDGLFCNGAEHCVDHPTGRYCATAWFSCEAGCDEALDRCCRDRDGDGYAELGCGAGDDCADDDPAIYPYGWELCGGGDEDCNPATLGWDGDADGDGHARPDCCQALAGGGVVCGDDCDDGWSGAHPGAVETCDLRDDDCDGAIDEGMELATLLIRADCDGDGYGDAAHGVIECWPGAAVRGPLTCPDGWWSYEERADCDDDNAYARPDEGEYACDGVDDDCDGVVDQPGRDADGDGYPYFACDGTQDCDDGSASVHPGAEELCDQADTDCDPTTAREDTDLDGHLAPGATCIGDTLPRDDCDDTQWFVHPGSWERCNGVDDDCDGTIDGASAYCSSSGATATECRDARCIDLVCRAGLDRCTDPERCSTYLLHDESHCGACGTRCGSGACVAGVCETFADLAIAGDRTVGLTPSGSAFAITAGGATNVEGTWGAIVRAVGGGARTCVAFAEGGVVCPGRWPEYGVEVPGAIEVGAGGAHHCARTEGGRIWCWGSGIVGELGDGTIHSEWWTAPVAVLGIEDAIALAVASQSACAVRSGGEIRCWGNGYYGTLGVGTTEVSATPVTVTMPRAIAIAAGAHHVCALESSGSLWCWGDNTHGQLGLPASTTPALTPQRVPLDGVVAIAAGGSSTCAVTGAGELWCWGANDAGQLGDGTRIDRHAPVLVDTDVASAAIGIAHACLVRPSGAIACWGENSEGRLGDGTLEDAFRPTPLDWAP